MNKLIPFKFIRGTQEQILSYVKQNGIKTGYVYYDIEAKSFFIGKNNSEITSYEDFLDNVDISTTKTDIDQEQLSILIEEKLSTFEEDITQQINSLDTDYANKFSEYDNKFLEQSNKILELETKIPSEGGSGVQNSKTLIYYSNNEPEEAEDQKYKYTNNQITNFSNEIGVNDLILNLKNNSFYVVTEKITNGIITKKITSSYAPNEIKANGTGVLYGSKVFDEDVEEYKFAFTDVSNGEMVIDSLILNIPDGIFYRVTQLLEDGAITEKIKLAGGGSGSVDNLYILNLDAGAKGENRYFSTSEKKTIIDFRFSATNLKVYNAIKNIRYEFKINSGSTNIVLNDTKTYPFSTTTSKTIDINFDISKYISSLSSTATNTINITATDIFGKVLETKIYVNLVDLKLEDVSNDLGMTTLNFTENTLDLSSTLKPSGNDRLSKRKIIYKVYYNNEELTDKSTDIVFDEGQSFSEQVKRISIDKSEEKTHGVFKITAQLTGTTSYGQTYWSNEIERRYIVLDPEVTEPVMTGINPYSNGAVQYSLLSFPFLIGHTTNTGKASIELIVVDSNGDEIQRTNQEVELQKVNNFKYICESSGVYNFILKYNEKEYVFGWVPVSTYSGVKPQVYVGDSCELNLSVKNRSNNEPIEDRKVWYSHNNNLKAILEDFHWGEESNLGSNGWITDEDNLCLKLSQGAKLKIEDLKNGGYYRPFNSKKNITTEGMTIELDFKIAGVRDYSKPIISCLSTDDSQILAGFLLTGEKATLNSNELKVTGSNLEKGESVDESILMKNNAVQSLSPRYVENERIHLSYVINRSNSNDVPGYNINPYISVYLQGVLSGLAQYSKTDSFNDTNPCPAYLTIDSSYADIYIYNIRIYNQALGWELIQQNYLATLNNMQETVIEYSHNNIVKNGEIDLDSIENEGYDLNIPYIKLTGGRQSSKWEVKQNTEDISSYGLPTAKKDFRFVNFEYFDPKNSSRNVSYKIKAQRGSGEETVIIDSIPDLKVGDKIIAGAYMYGQGTSSMEYPVKNLRFKFKLNSDKSNKFIVKENVPGVDILTFKADYMESSSSHNTGTGNLIDILLTNLSLQTDGSYKTPPQKQEKDKHLLTAINGYPVIIFWRAKDTDKYTYVGKYNLNIDKASPDVFGFDPKYKIDTEEYAEITDYVGNEDYRWDPDFYYTKNEEGEYVSAAGTTYVPGQKYYQKGKVHCFEFLNNGKYLTNFIAPDNVNNVEDISKAFDLDWVKDGFESRYPEDREDLAAIASFKEMWLWVQSTQIFGEDDSEKQSKLDKFKSEFKKYFDFDFACFYFVLTYFLLMIDSRAKNMMMATWDDKIWYPIFYDMDTMLGLNNSGYNEYNFDVMDTDADIYNGKDSTLWNNFRECFQEDIEKTYNKMRQNGLDYKTLLSIYGDSQADSWYNAFCNADALYKYDKPLKEGYYDGSNNNIVGPGNASYLYAAQGRRTHHRQWWLKNRFNFLDSQYAAIDETKNLNSYYNLRLSNISTLGEGSTNQKEWNTTKEKFKPSQTFSIIPLQKMFLAIQCGSVLAKTEKPVLANTEATLTVNVENPQDTETYILNGPYLKDLGDLYNKYVGKFFPPTRGEPKIETLKLGNKENGYYNGKNVEVSFNNLRYLKYLDISGIASLSGNLNLEQCYSLKTLWAVRTQVASVTLPLASMVEELHLPGSITSLNLNAASYLTDLTIGTYDSDSNSFNNNYSKITSLTLEDMPNFDSYTLLNKIIKQKVENAEGNTNKLGLNYRLTNINWNITNEDEVLKESETLLGQNYNNVVTKINILEMLKIAANNSSTVNTINDLTGTLTLSIPNCTIDEQILFDEYYNTFPNLEIKVEENTDNLTLIKAYSINFYDGANMIYKKYKYREKTKIEDDSFGEILIPSKSETNTSTFTFSNKWTIKKGEEEIELGKNEDESYSWGAIGILKQDIDIIPMFDSKTRYYSVTFCNENGSELKVFNNIEYQGKIPLPNKIPYKENEEEWTDEDIYSFEGWTRNKNSMEVIDIASLKMSSLYDKVSFYPVFLKKTVKENIHPDWFDYTDEEYEEENRAWNIVGKKAVLKYDIQKQKLTIPKEVTINDVVYPIISIGYGIYNSSVSELHFEEDSKVRKIDDKAFMDNQTLTYIDIPDSLRAIGNEAFRRCSLRNTEFGKNLREIGNYAFSNGLFISDLNQKTLTIGYSIEKLGNQAFANLWNYEYETLIIGSAEEKSRLSLSISGEQIFLIASTHIVENCYIYSTTITEEKAIEKMFGNIRPTISII